MDRETQNRGLPSRPARGRFLSGRQNRRAFRQTPPTATFTGPTTPTSMALTALRSERRYCPPGSNSAKRTPDSLVGLICAIPIEPRRPFISVAVSVIGGAGSAIARSNFAVSVGGRRFATAPTLRGWSSPFSRRAAVQVGTVNETCVVSTSNSIAVLCGRTNSSTLDRNKVSTRTIATVHGRCGTAGTSLSRKSSRRESLS